MKRFFLKSAILAMSILPFIAPGQLRGQNGVVVSWGERTIPLSFYEARRIISISAGGSHNIALRFEGTVLAWGNNGSGQSSVPAGLDQLSQVAVGAAHNVAIKSDGTVVAWGDNTYGQGTVPAGLSGVTHVAAGSR